MTAVDVIASGDFQRSRLDSTNAHSSDIRYYSHDNLLKNNSEKYYLRVRILHSRSGETTVFGGSNKLCRGKIRRAVAEKI